MASINELLSWYAADEGDLATFGLSLSLFFDFDLLEEGGGVPTSELGMVRESFLSDFEEDEELESLLESR